MPCKAAGQSTDPRADDGEHPSAALIADDRTLDACVAMLGREVGVDTEFIRERTFFPIPALYQLAGDSGVALVDAQASATFSGLRDLLLDAARTKVVHACSEDLEVIARHLDLRPVNLVDTQVAHGFLGEDFSPSYAKLVEHFLGLKLDKHQTRSDWLQRPLSREQVAYAREDAAYLVPLWHRQRRTLSEKGRLDWFLEDMARVLDTPAQTADNWFHTVNGAWRLKSRELAVLRSLVDWRESEARHRDVPRAYTVRDEHLLALARQDSLDVGAVTMLLPRRTAHRYARTLIWKHQQGLEDPNPPPRIPPPLTRRGGEVVKELRALAQAEATRLGIAPEILGRRRDLEADYRHYRAHGALPARYDGWRAGVVRQAFEGILAIP